MFTGCYTALITPFKDDRVDYETFGRLIEFQIAQGVSGLVPCGTTGESATLTEEEHREVVDFTIKTAKGRVKVLAGTGSNCTATSIRLTREAQASGADGALLITPYYNKPGQEGLYRHYRAVAESCDLPLMLYNVPGRTAVNLLPETVARLAKDCPTIVGLKDATGSLAQANATLALLKGREFDLLSGEDGIVLPLLAVGAKGVISVFSNIAPRSMVELVAAWESGDLKRAREINLAQVDLAQTLFIETNPAPVKAAAALLGLAGKEVRLPLAPVSEASLARLKTSLKDFSLEPEGGFKHG